MPSKIQGYKIGALRLLLVKFKHVEHKNIYSFLKSQRGGGGGGGGGGAQMF